MNATGIYNYLDCSNLHITNEDCFYLRDCAAGDSYNLENTLLVLYNEESEEGFMVHVDKEFISYQSESLQAVLNLAVNSNCYWIRLDQLGTIHQNLNKYEW